MSEIAERARRFVRALEQMRHLGGVRPWGESLRADLSLSQFRALMVLAQRPGLAQKEVAEALRLTPAATSTALRPLGANGLVRRETDQADARMIRLFLTPEGEAVVSQMQATRRQAAAALLARLAPEEQETVVALLEKALVVDRRERGAESDE
ncbi:MAG: MarR family transcriptional regulator [Ardenticatenaceae bacterium]|nr:MarR family transcriptional regulator [Ardenticatenaceae bacterium]HBY94384.1 hypothetical protein [Chloroflexota bacterium]